MIKSGVICTSLRLAASGVAFFYGANVAGIEIIDPGTAGSLQVDNDYIAGQSGDVLLPAIAYSALKSGQFLPFVPGGFAAIPGAIYVTLPTGAIVNVIIAAR